MAAHLGGEEWILIAPDGTLSFLPWGALPGRADGSYLLEEHGFGLIPAARPARRGARRAAAGAAPGRLLVVGGVDYDNAELGDAPGLPRPQAAAPLLASATTRAGAFAGDRLKVDALPGTRGEAERVSDVFRTIGPGRLGAEAVRFDGAMATKPRVRSAMAEKSVSGLHLATHGYFAALTFASALAPGRLKGSASAARSTAPTAARSMACIPACSRAWSGPAPTAPTRTR